MVRNTSEVLSCLKEMYIFEIYIYKILYILDKNGVLEHSTLSFSSAQQLGLRHSPKLKARDGLK